MGAESPRRGAGTDPEEAQLYQRLVQRIDAEGGSVPFVEFMELVLYDPDNGYYTGPAAKFGARGDFVTAPELSPLLACGLAGTADSVLQQIGGGSVLEVGAGTGRMAADLLRNLAVPENLIRYQILERSADLRARQQRLLAHEVPDWMERIEWIDVLPESGFRGFIFANELLDAIAVNRIQMTARGVAELHVSYDANGIRERVGSLSDGRLAERIAPLGIAPGYRTEVGLRREAWVERAGAAIERGALMLIDYGYPRREYYHPQRRDGTLLCHHRHRAHSDPYVHLGQQDITAHVDFTGIAEAALAAGLDLLGFTTQAGYLLASGVLEMTQIRPADDALAAINFRQNIKRLLLPGQMGELFKVLIAGRGLESTPHGFGALDQRHRL